MLIAAKTRLGVPFSLLGLAVSLGAACARGVELTDFGGEGGAAGVGLGTAGAFGIASGGASPEGGPGKDSSAASSTGSSGGGAAGSSTSVGGGGNSDASLVDGSGGAFGSDARDAPLADRLDASIFDASETAPPRDAPSDVGCPGAGTALSFDRTKSSTVAIPGGSLPIGAAPRTVEMWVLNKSPMANWASDNTVFEYGGRSDHQAFGVDFDVFPKLELYVIPIGQSLFFDSGAAQDQWFHLAATYDGSMTHAFVNGIEKGMLNVGAIATTASSLYVGSGVMRNYLNGSIDEVRVWGVARTQAQIQDTMGVRLVGNETGLVGYWRFDEGAGTTTSDASGGNHPGTLTSGPTWIPSPVTLGCR